MYAITTLQKHNIKNKTINKLQNSRLDLLSSHPWHGC
jgi:hypothetical protein